MAVLLDSGFLFASLNASESEHKAAIRVLENIREPIVLAIPAITEVTYLLARDTPARSLLTFFFHRNKLRWISRKLTRSLVLANRERSIHTKKK